MNLSELSLEQLADLRDEVIATLNDRVSLRQKELQNEMERVGSFASRQRQKPTTARPAKPKYQKGENNWSGRGTQPAWVKQHLALGGTLAELEAARSS